MFEDHRKESKHQCPTQAFDVDMGNSKHANDATTLRPAATIRLPVV